jgi:hypothetical protein
MSREEPSPASELISALREVSADSNLYGALQERVSGRLARSVVLDGAPAGSSGPPHPQAELAGRAAALAGKGVAIGWLVPAFAAGVLSGISADHAYTRLSAQRAVASPPAAIVTEHAPPATPEARAATAPVPSAIPAERSFAGGRSSMIHVPSADMGTGLGAEQRLLDAARTALAQGTPAAAMAPLELHAHRFPKGKLSEEREALCVRILALLGRDDEARARADGFRRRFPGSLFAPVVDNALDAISGRKSKGAPNQE